MFLHGEGRVAQRFGDVVCFDIWMLFEDLLHRHPIGDHGHHAAPACAGHGCMGTAHAGDGRDPRERHNSNTIAPHRLGLGLSAHADANDCGRRVTHSGRRAMDQTPTVGRSRHRLVRSIISPGAAGCARTDLNRQASLNLRWSTASGSGGGDHVRQLDRDRHSMRSAAAR